MQRICAVEVGKQSTSVVSQPKQMMLTSVYQLLLRLHWFFISIIVMPVVASHNLIYIVDDAVVAAISDLRWRLRWCKSQRFVKKCEHQPTYNSCDPIDFIPVSYSLGIGLSCVNSVPIALKIVLRQAGQVRVQLPLSIQWGSSVVST